ncbi:MAG: ABC transporter substrate-binding protein [Elusimicrobia bacterium CG08_land_8_20_14_0_20_51_18]|nr:MAG: ABC transporter substrate-binding protein [Elusimicrobia bacterium CG08_land_8_20_14_0_20_51_18]
MNCFKEQAQDGRPKAEGRKIEVRGQRSGVSAKNFLVNSRFSRFRILAFLALLLPLSADAETTIKFATLAPEGTSWTKILRQYAKEVEKKTAGRIKFKIYAGGISGDEKDVVRKIRIGQLNAAGFTGFGIGEIAPEMRVLDAPFLFKNPDEIDHIYKEFDSEFRKIFDDKGFTLLGWSEVGGVYVFSNSPIVKTEDAAKFKMWIWEGDPIAQATFEAMGVKPIPLSITDVMTSLQTGMIDAVYGAPAAIIPLQWYNKMKYALDLPITNASGAILLSKKTADSLTAADRKLLMELSEKHFKNLNETSRKDNARSLQTLKSKNISFTRLSEEESKKLALAGKTAREKLSGRIFSKELLDKIEKEIESFRKAKQAGAPRGKPANGK